MVRTEEIVPVVLCSLGRLPYPDHIREHAQDASTYVALARRLRRMYVVVASRDERVHVSRLGRVAVVCLPQGRGALRNYFRYWVGALRLGMRLFRRSGVSVFQVSEPILAGPVGLLLRRFTGRPLVVHLQGDLLDLPVSELHPWRNRAIRGISRFVAKRADRVRCISRGVVRSAESHGIRPERLVFLPSRVDVGVFSRERQREAGIEVRRRFGLDGRPVILFLGNLIVHKGLSYLLRAMAGLGQDHPEARLLLVGSGPREAELRAEAQQLGIADRVIFAGRAGYADIPGFLAACDLLALPSLNEGLPRVVLEAMAMEVPVVASRVGGVPEIVDDGETGLLVPAQDADALETALRRLLDEPGLRRDMGGRGRERIRGEFEYETNILQYAEMIADAAGSPRPRTHPERRTS